MTALRSQGAASPLSRLIGSAVGRFRRFLPSYVVWRWGRFWTNGRDTEGQVHTLPWNDEVAHGDEDCVCGPTPNEVETEDGGLAWYYVHHAVDGRGDDAWPPRMLWAVLCGLRRGAAARCGLHATHMRRCPGGCE